MGVSESKLRFSEALVVLSEREIGPDDDKYWKSFVEEPLLLSEFFALLPLSELRTIRDQRPENFRTLISKVICALMQCQLVDMAFDALRAETQSLITISDCVRCLTRLLPVSFEKKDFAEFFWKCDANDAKDAPNADNRVLGEKLCDLVVDLLFLMRFTLPKPVSTENAVHVLYTIWEVGIGLGESLIETSAIHLANRAEVLKLFLVLASHSMYTTADQVRKQGNPFLERIVSLEEDVAIALFCSLFNTILNYKPSHWLPDLTGESMEELVMSAVQTLCILLDYRCLRDAEARPFDDGHEPPAVESSNIFIRLAASIHIDREFEMIVQSLLTIIGNAVEYDTSYLPIKRLVFYPESLILMWRLFELNPAFRSYVAGSGSALELLKCMLYFLYKSSNNELETILFHTSVFLLLILSAEREFCANLNRQISSSLPPAFSFVEGTYADLAFIAILLTIVRTQASDSQGTDGLLTVLCNVAPHIKGLSLQTVEKLLNATGRFGSFEYLFINGGCNQRVYNHLLTCIDSLLQYQSEGNHNLVYGILKRKGTFLAISALQYEEYKKSLVEKTKDAGLEPIEPLSEDSFLRYRDSLPLQRARTVILQLEPQITRRFSTEYGKKQLTYFREIERGRPVLEHIKIGSMAGLMPPPDPIVPRRYQENSAVSQWLATSIYGLLFVRHARPPLWMGTNVQLFVVKQVSVDG